MKEFIFKGRIKNKSEIKEFVLNKKKGKMFSLVLYNKSNEIFVTFFNDMVDVYFP